MEKKKNLGFFVLSWQIISLAVLFFGLLIGLLLVKKRQEIRKKAYEEVCNLSFDQTAIPQDKWRQITPPAGGKYQIIASGSNSFTLSWSCPSDYPVNTFRVKDGTNDITTKCKAAEMQPTYIISLPFFLILVFSAVNLKLRPNLKPKNLK